MNTPPPLPSPPQAKFSWIHYVTMILVCWFVTFVTALMMRGIYGNLSEEADATLSGLMEATQDIRQEINEQQEQIDILWEKIEEIKNR